jgi:hypothetical protein
MGPTETTRCRACQAIVNPVWESCAACRSPLIPDWHTEYRRLADLTTPLEPGDPRLPAILQALDQCDNAFLAGDVGKFRVAVQCVEATIAEQAPPEPPLQPGWIIAYRDRRKQLLDGIVSRCDRTGNAWMVQLTNGTAIPLKWVTSVGRTDGEGRVLAAWTVREHSHTGESAGRS